MRKDIERKIVNGFVLERRRERAMFELFSPRMREHFLRNIESFLNPAYIHQVKACDIEHVYPILKSRGAPDYCYILNLNEELDGRIMPLKLVMTEDGYQGTALVSCIHGKLAYMLGEYYEHFLVTSN